MVSKMNETEKLRSQLLGLAKENIKQAYSTSDVHIIKAVNLMDDLDMILNLLTEQLREWMGIHFPELNYLEKSQDRFVELVCELGERKNFTYENVSKICSENVEKICEAAKSSAGKEFGSEELMQVVSLSKNAFLLKKQRKELQEFVEEEMKKKWPSFTKEAGSLIGARMLAKLGSGKKLAFAPSSTIQLVGAQKALFAHLRGKAKPPKYGYLYGHPLVQSAKKNEQGKTARKIAGKILIAARRDFFSRKGFESDIDAAKKNEEQEKRERDEKRERKRTEHPREFERKESKPFRNEFKRDSNKSESTHNRKWNSNKPIRSSRPERRFDRKKTQSVKGDRKSHSFNENRQTRPFGSFKKRQFGPKKDDVSPRRSFSEKPGFARRTEGTKNQNIGYEKRTEWKSNRFSKSQSKDTGGNLFKPKNKSFGKKTDFKKKFETFKKNKKRF
jgi:nucleolar protein 56